MVKISVIIPNYNHARFLKQRIDSVLQQTFSDFEVIVLDDCSTDNSREIIETYRNHPKISAIIYNKENSGSPFTQWKKGIVAAKAEWVWVAESDDFATDQFLERLFDTATKHNDLGLVYSDSIFTGNIDGQQTKSSLVKNSAFCTSRWSENYITSGLDELNNYLSRICTINNSSACIFNKRYIKDDLESLGKFKTCGDWFLYNLIASKSSISYIAEPLNYIRIHNYNTSINIYNEKKIVFQADYFYLLKITRGLNVTSRMKRYDFISTYLSISDLRRTSGLKILKHFISMAKLDIRLFYEYVVFNFVQATRKIGKRFLHCIISKADDE